MKLQYIKANGEYYKPQEAGKQHPEMIEGVCYPVCYIKKLWFGRWQVDYYDELNAHYEKGYSRWNENQKPSHRLILYPSVIEEIKYTLQE